MIFRALFFERDAEIGRKDNFSRLPEVCGKVYVYSLLPRQFVQLFFLDT